MVKKNLRSLPIFLAAAVLLPIPAFAQDSSGAFEAAYPEAHALLLRAQEVQARVLEHLADDLQGIATVMPMMPMPGMDHGAMMDEGPMAAAPPEEGVALFQEFADALRADEPPQLGPREIQAGNGLTERLSRIVARTHDFQHQVLDIYVDDRVTDKVAAVEAAVAEYELDTDHALPTNPKSMDLWTARRSATAMRLNFPYLAGLVWSSAWLEYASFEPFFLRDTVSEREAGIETIKLRFRSKLGDPPGGFPVEMPMVPTIAPGLRLAHPEVAAILDNMDMMVAAVADVLVDRRVPDKTAAVEDIVGDFTAPVSNLASLYDWNLMALRHGIFNQGGPALGTLDRSERNADPHLMVGGMPN